MVIILSDRGIAQAIKDGSILVENPNEIAEEDSRRLIQPASLDFTILDQNSKKVKKIKGLEALTLDIEDQTKPHPEAGDNFVTFWPGKIKTILVGTVKGYNGLFPIVELRSTMRRNGLFSIPKSFSDSGGHSVEIGNPRAYPISIEKESKLAQIIWSLQGQSSNRNRILQGQGYEVTSTEQITELLEKGEIKIGGNPEIRDGKLILHASSVMNYKSEGHLMIYRDNRKIRAETKTREGNEHLIIPGQLADIKTLEKIELSDKVAMQLIRLDNRARFRDGGWVDPGYRGPLSLQPVAYDKPIKIAKGSPIIACRTFLFPDGVKDSYGSKIGSQYKVANGDLHQLNLFESHRG